MTVDNVSLKAFTPAMLGSLSLRNRVIKAATYEGKSPGAIPGDALKQFHLQVARGGVAMTTLGYCSTEADGRINDQMLYLHEGIKPAIQNIIETLHATGTKVSGQMTHCGYFSKNKNLQRLRRPLGPSWQINPLGFGSGLPIAGAMSIKDIDYLVNTYAEAAHFMQNAGFDAIEVHVGHGYGISQFISPKTNRRTDSYGGSLLNRTRLATRVIETIRSTVGDSMPIIAKMSMTDGVKDGLQENEALDVASILDKAGCDALIPSGGTSSFNVMYMLRGSSIAEGLLEQETNPLMKLGLKWFGKKMFHDAPFHELYFRDIALRVKERVDCHVVYIGGCSTLESIQTLMHDGFDFIQMGRALIKDPNFVNNAFDSLAINQPYDSECIHCNRCVTLIEAPGGIHCPYGKPNLS